MGDKICDVEPGNDVLEKNSTIASNSENTKFDAINDNAELQKNANHEEYLTVKLNEMEQKLSTISNKWILAQADLENLKKRTEREISNIRKYALENIISELLTTVDNLERSLNIINANDQQINKDLYIGIELTFKSFLEILSKYGVSVIDPIGMIFNPEQHSAISVKETTDFKSNIILEVIQKGYILKDRLLRPALVIVAK